jgi:CheY-like chemotaxis protein
MQRLLLVDYARSIAELEGTPLARREIVRTRLAHSLELIEQARQLKPDLVLIEEGEFCPEAFDAARQLAREPALEQTTIVYAGNPLARARVLATGVDLFLSRPVTARALCDMLERNTTLRQRLAARRAVDEPAELCWDGHPRQAVHVVDLSHSGARIVAAEPTSAAQRGQLRLISLSRAGGLPVEWVRSTSDGCAVRFEGLKPSERAMVSRFMRRASERRHDLHPAQGLPLGGSP